MEKNIISFLIILSNLIIISLNAFSLTFCQLPSPENLMDEKQTIKNISGSYDAVDSPQIISFEINTIHLKEGYRVDAWANIQDTQGQNDIVEVKAIDGNGNEFILNLQSSNFYYGNNFYGTATPPLGLTRIVATDQVGKSVDISV